MRTALIDGDIFAYESAAAAEIKTEFGTHVDEQIAFHNLDKRIETVAKATHATDILVALSCPSRLYFRHDIMPLYKAGRGEKPVALAAVKNYIRRNYRTKTRSRLEADDVLGILATGPMISGEKVVISKDKDLMQIPGLHLNHSDVAAGVFEVTPTQGDYFHLFQTLTGDQTDGYPGCPGIGPVKAKKILGEKPEWSAVLEAFVKKGLTEADALLQARVSRILRWEDWNSETKEPILWQPKV